MPHAVSAITVMLLQDATTPHLIFAGAGSGTPCWLVLLGRLSVCDKKELLGLPDDPSPLASSFAFMRFSSCRTCSKLGLQHGMAQHNTAGAAA